MPKGKHCNSHWNHGTTWESTLWVVYDHIVTPKSVTQHIGARNVWHGTFFHVAQPPVHTMHLECTVYCTVACTVACSHLHTTLCTTKPNCSITAILITNGDAAFKSCKVTSLPQQPPQYQSWHPAPLFQAMSCAFKHLIFTPVPILTKSFAVRPLHVLEKGPTEGANKYSNRQCAVKKPMSLFLWQKIFHSAIDTCRDDNPRSLCSVTTRRPFQRATTRHVSF